MNHRITRRSFVKTTGVAAGLAPFASLMRANAGYPDAGTDLRISQIPYGAVYFRKSNPPREDWEQDYKTASEDGINTEYFREIFRFTKREQLVSASNPAIQARLHRKDKHYFLWIVNPTREARETGIKISDALGKMKFTASHWNEYRMEMADNRFPAQVPARDALILEFES